MVDHRTVEHFAPAPPTPKAPPPAPPASRPQDASVGELVTRASEQVSDLVRQELRLAQAEMTDKGKRFGIGGGMLGGAGTFAFIALQALAATVIALLALALPVWGAAAITTGILIVVAAALAFVGQRKIKNAVPPVPEQAIDSIKTDMAQIKGKAQR